MRTITIFVAVGILLVVLPGSAIAGPEEEATRQLELAEEDLANDNFERAAASAASALRLDPARHDALVVRGLALQGLGRLDDAAALLRAYRDLRGTLPLDERVEPALQEIAQFLVVDRQAAEQPEPEPEAPATLDGPVAVVYGPEDDERAAERAYAAARPFLGDEPASSILPLAMLLPRGADLVVLGASTPCTDVPLEGALEEHLGDAEAAVTELEPEAADQAAGAAEMHLACGEASVQLWHVAQLLAVRAATRWVAGEPEGASRLWQELFALQPDRVVDSSLAPAAQALQLDAKMRAAEEPAQADLQLVVPEGWMLQVDGRERAAGAVPAGRRVVHLVGPEGQRVGAVVELERGEAATVATAQGLRQAAQEPQPDGAVLRWLADELAPLLEQDAQAVLLVNLAADPPLVRHFDGTRFLVLSSTGRAARRGPPAATTSGAVPCGASAVLLGGGLAATAVGVIVAALAHREGIDLQGGMQTGIGFSDSYSAYQSAWTQERVGTGLAIGGGVVAAAGAITFVIPQPKPRVEVAAR